MTNLWLGDFRTKQLQYWQGLLDEEEKVKEEDAKKKEESEKADRKPQTENSENAEDEENEVIIIKNENLFNADNDADFSWFETVGSQEIEAVATNTNVIIMLGLNDCINSCTWNSLNIETIATNYLNCLKKLTEQFTSAKLYFCAVNPVDASYPKINYKGDLIPASDLNAKIEVFNKIIKAKCLDEGAGFLYGASTGKDKEDKNKDKCNVIFIDSYNYFKTTSFSTRDGIRYTHDTCLQVLDFVKSYIRIASGTAFTQRTTGPTKESIYYFSDNPFYPTYGLPNCTCYAWGRFYEILGSKPKLSTGNAEDFYPNKSDGYERGDTPQVGAVMCWEGVGDAAGHVAIVEEVISNTEVKTSESGYARGVPYDPNNSNHFWNGHRHKGNGNWGSGSGYVFQGFIYNPKVINGGISGSGTLGDYVYKTQVIAKTAYLTEDEMRINARYIWQYLGSRGWTLNAVAGMLGNMQSESTISPNMYEKTNGISCPVYPTPDEVGAYMDAYKQRVNRYPGCGLTGWTWDEHGYDPSTWKGNKYIKWCYDRNLDFRDMDSGLERILWEVENNKQWTKRDMYSDLPTFKSFTTSTKPAEYLAACFCATYEICVGWNTESVQSFRGNRGKKWFEYLLPFSPEMPAPTSLVNLKIDENKPTKIKGSFVVRNGEKGVCKIYKEGSKTFLQKIDYTKKALTGIDEKAKDSDKAGTKSADITKVIHFEFSNLTPDTSYKIFVEITGKAKEEKLDSEIIFKTLQDYPESVSNIELQVADKKFPNELFKLTCELNNYWGYWKRYGNGYTLQLLINGKCIAEKTLNNFKEKLTFKLSEFFQNINLKLGDTVQIGLRTWVIDNKGKKIFDDCSAVVSNSICMLKQPFVTYLNTEKYK